MKFIVVKNCNSWHSMDQIVLNLDRVILAFKTSQDKAVFRISISNDKIEDIEFCCYHDIHTIFQCIAKLKDDELLELNHDSIMEIIRRRD